MAGSGFRFEIQARGDRLEVSIEDEIGKQADGFGISGAAVCKQIRSSNRPVHLTVSSLGGSFFDGLSIYNQLKAHPYPTSATITSVAFSAASLICCGCQDVAIAATATYGLHRASTLGHGNESDLLDSIQWLKQCDQSLRAAYAAKTGKSPEQIQQWLVGTDGKDGTLFNAEQALAHGFVNRIIGTAPMSNSKTPKRTKAEWRLLEGRIRSHSRGLVEWK